MITVLGGTGFIGSHLVRALRAANVEHHVVPREVDPSRAGSLGKVIYCIGLTADFRQRPLDTVVAHVGILESLLRHGTYDSLLYLSSTRVYGEGEHPASESSVLSARPDNPSDLYNLSKALGESLGLASGRPFRVARLSNVYGREDTSENFLTSVVQAARSDDLVLRTSLDSTKDFVRIEDVVEILPRLLDGRERIYDVASGQNVTNGDIADHLHRRLGCRVRVEDNAPSYRLRPILIDRIRDEFGFSPVQLIPQGLDALL